MSVLLTNHTLFYIDEIKRQIEYKIKGYKDINNDLFYEIVIECIREYIEQNFSGNKEKIKEYLYFQDFNEIVYKRYGSQKILCDNDFIYESFIQHFTKIY
jgi:hypothetical protein